MVRHRIAHDADDREYRLFREGFCTSHTQCACPTAASLQESKALVKAAPNRYTDL